MRKIRRNLREYQDYWFWGIYNLLWCRRLDRTPDIMTELRLLTDDIFRYCPRLVHDIAIGKMAEMEDDEHIDQFLDTYASAEDLSRPTLQLNRYRARGEWDKHEPVRMFHLWFTIVNLVDTPKNWMKSAEKDPRFLSFYQRIQECIITRPKQEE